MCNLLNKIMTIKEFFLPKKIKFIILSILIIISLYLFTALEFVYTFPETCGLLYPIHFHFNCSFAQILPWISLIILPISSMYLIILLIVYLKNRYRDIIINILKIINLI